LLFSVDHHEEANVDVCGMKLLLHVYPNPAILIIDTQLGFFTDEKEPLYNQEELVKKIRSLIDKARAAMVPVIFVQHDGPKGSILDPETAGWAIHPAIQPLKGEIVIRKITSSAFVDTPLDSELKRRQIETLIIAGLQSESCVDSTTRHASFLGYKVVLVEDAHSTFDSSLLTASQIIAHHNMVLGNEFAELRREAEIWFSWEGCPT
jgi:nicotinamidase-related amidase